MNIQYRVRRLRSLTCPTKRTTQTRNRRSTPPMIARPAGHTISSLTFKSGLDSCTVGIAIFFLPWLERATFKGAGEWRGGNLVHFENRRNRHYRGPLKKKKSVKIQWEKNKQNVTNLGPVRNSQEGVTPQNLSTEILKGIGVPRSRDIGGHLLGHQESVDVDPCAR